MISMDFYLLGFKSCRVLDLSSSSESVSFGLEVNFGFLFVMWLQQICFEACGDSNKCIEEHERKPDQAD